MLPISASTVPVVQTADAVELRGVPGLPITIDEFSKIGQAQSVAAANAASRLTGVAHSRDMDELGKGLIQLLSTARGYDPSRWNKGMLGGLIRASSKQLDQRFKTVDQQVEALLQSCDHQITKFSSAIGDLGALYQENEDAYHQLGQAIRAGEARINWASANVPDVDVDDPMSAQRVQDWQTAITFAQQAVHQLRLAQTMCQLQGPQIKRAAEGCYLMIQKFNGAKTLTIPMLKRQYAQYLIEMQLKKGAELSKAIDVETDRAFMAAAKAGHQNAIDVNSAMARNIVSIETLKTVYAELESSITDVEKIRSDMVAKIKSELPQLQQLSQQIQTLQIGAAKKAVAGPVF